MRSTILILLVGNVAGLVAGCRPSSDRVVVYISVDDVFARPILAAFEQETGIGVDAVYDAEATKTTGLYQRLLAERTRPRADVFWNSEPCRTALLEAAGLLAPTTAPALADLPPQARSLTGCWTGFAARARVLIYHRPRLADAERPRSVFDLTLPRFRGQAGISDPLFGTMATHAGALRLKLGASRMENFFRALVANDVKIVPGNSVVRDRVVSGELLCGLTDTDDAHVALLRGDPIGIVFPDQEPYVLEAHRAFAGTPEPIGCLVFPNTVALIRGSPNPGHGARLVDYILRPQTEAALARGESAQIPLRAGIPPPARLQIPAPLVLLSVDWSETARALEASVEFLRELLVK